LNEEIIQKLLGINQQFYEEFGSAFSATRQRIQPGVRRFLSELATDGDWLDLGCGSGALGCEWQKSGLRGSYTGLDFSETLLTEALRVTAGLSGAEFQIDYLQADLLDPEWDRLFSQRKFDGICAFAALHHIPDSRIRSRIFEKVNSLLKPGGTFVYSVWQFQNSEKLMSRVLPWETVGLQAADLEPRDTLLDWRFTLPGEPEKTGQRYVHLFEAEELSDLAAQAGFRIVDTFFSDGKSENLALYQVAKKN